MAAKNNITPRLCTWQGCGRIHRAKGFCLMHYKRVRNCDSNIEGPKPFSLPAWASQADIAYAAGFIDADGTIGINAGKCPTTRNKMRFATRISAICVDREPIDFLASLFGGKCFTRPPRRTNVNARFPIHEWGAASDRACWIAKIIAPYLKIKKIQALTIVEYVEGKVWRRGAVTVSVLPEAELERRRKLHEITRYRNQRRYLLGATA